MIIGTHPAAGHFTSLGDIPRNECIGERLLTGCAEDWKKGALGVINAVLKEPLKLSVLNVVGGGDQAWATVELEAKGGVCKNGMGHTNELEFVGCEDSD